MGRNLSEGALDKAVLHVRIPLTLKYKIRRKYGNAKSEVWSDATLAALEEACKDVRLTKADYAAIEAEQSVNLEKRMQQRARRDRGELGS